MGPWKLTLIVLLPSVTALSAMFLILCNLLCRRKPPPSSSSSSSSSMSRQGYIQDLSTSSAKPARIFSSRRKIDPAIKHSDRMASAWRLAFPVKNKPFDWSEHPTQVAEALENRWTAWAFRYASPLSSSSSSSSHSWGICSSNSGFSSSNREHEPEIVWEIRHGSEYVQKLWFNPGLQPRKGHGFASIQALQSVLPLPGPPLGGSRIFPQTAYFEVTILADNGVAHHADACRRNYTNAADNELAKLISKGSVSEKFAAQETHRGRSKGEESDAASRQGSSADSSSVMEEEEEKAAMERSEALAIGLSVGLAPPFRFPGHDVGSVGFHSNGYLFLNGALQFEQEPPPGLPAIKQRMWSVSKTTVGCGFDPQSRTVFFTVDGEKVYELASLGSDFARPLYPTVASNYDVVVLVNFGQISFEYALANKQRTSSEPYFSRLFSRSTTTRKDSVNEDSGDLFSIGRVDPPQWLPEMQAPGAAGGGGGMVMHRHTLSESDSELFEIVLEA